MFDRDSDDLADGVARVERVVRALKDVLEPTATRRRSPADVRAQRVAFEDDRAAARNVEAHDRARQRCLARTGLTDEREALARPQLQGRVVDDLLVPVEGAERSNDEHRFGRCHGCTGDDRETEICGGDLRRAEAGHVMVRFELNVRRLGFTTARKNVTTAWREDAAVRPSPWWRDVAWNRLEGKSGGDVRDRLDEPARVRVTRTREEALHRSGLDHPARVHHEHALRKHRDSREVVTDVDRADVVLATEFAHRFENVRLSGDIETGRRLVEDDHLWSEQERHGDADALLLAAGELMRISAEKRGIGRERDLAERLADAIEGLARRCRPPVRLDHLDQLRPDRQRGVEGGGRVLGNVGDAAPAGSANLAGRSAEHLDPVDAYGAA